jgi:hypothetical protein
MICTLDIVEAVDTTRDLSNLRASGLPEGLRYGV